MGGAALSFRLLTGLGASPDKPGRRRFFATDAFRRVEQPGKMLSPDKRTKRQEAAISALLVIAGIVLAICLFAAGLLWRGKPKTKEASAVRSCVHADGRSVV